MSFNVHESLIVVILFRTDYSHYNQMFRHVVRDHSVFSLQSMMIRTQPESGRLLGSCQDIPWHGACKNVIRKNGSFSQHRHFLHDKFLSNDKSLRIHIGIVIERLFETARSQRILIFIEKRGKVFFSFSNDNLRYLAYYIEHWAIFRSRGRVW